ncbi:unnamed protein product [Rhizophagus irregularis]|nr:unnamed protein product [Rhizophagus irregularis]
MMAWEFSGSFWRVFFGCNISSTSKFPRHEFSVCSSVRSEHVRFDGRAFGMECRHPDLWTRRILTTCSLYVVMICGLWWFCSAFSFFIPHFLPRPESA